MTAYLPLIIAMMLVTYIPRLLPWLILSGRPLPPLLQRFLLYIPYTALGALIVRGVLEAPNVMMPATLAGIMVSAVCSWYRGGMVLSVSAAILVVFLMLSCP